MKTGRMAQFQRFMRLSSERILCYTDLLIVNRPPEESNGKVAVSGSGEAEGLAEAGEGLVAAGALDDDRQAHLADVDHADVDAALGQGAEHTPGDAGVGPHADAEDDQAGDVTVGLSPGGGVNLGQYPLRQSQGGLEVRQRDGEGELGPTADEVLDDHIDDDAAGGDGLEDPRAVAG